MATLPTELRRKLEAAIGKAEDTGGARAIAETAAAAALLRLDVDRAEPREHLNETERKLRVKLRARARQLGDRLRDGRQGIDRLTEACAYEHWHRMLFARFLAENGLLMGPEGVDVSIADCAEYAAEEGVDTWEVAGRFASRALPQIFRPDDPMLAVNLAAEHRKTLEGILAALPVEVFTASDSLGWVYQFWQARKKKVVNESEVKIGADELPAVTQLFTERYMVDFLLQNTLGAWWTGAGRALPMAMPYLRTLEDGSPAAGRFEGWPKTARELKVLDPCCGSGHFLVAAFEILVAFRIAEGLTARDACDAVFRENLHGLELDNRCVQIAAFALAMAAWKYPGAGGYRAIAAMSVACSGLSVAPMPMADETEPEKAKRLEDTKKIRDRWVRAGRDVRQQRGMGRLFDLFLDAPVLGSLIDPTRDMPETLLCARAEELRPVLERVLNEEPIDVDADEHESHVAARGIAEAANCLAGRYSLVATNVPFLARRKQGEVLSVHSDDHYADGKGDLCTVFIQRIIALCASGGSFAVVSPQTWWMQTTYRKYRQSLLSTVTNSILVDLGPSAFQDMNWWAAITILMTGTRAVPTTDHAFGYIDLAHVRGFDEKASSLASAALIIPVQREQVANPDSRIAPKAALGGVRLNEAADSVQGLVTGDDPAHVRAFWELAVVEGWRRLMSTTIETCLWGGRSFMVRWEDDGRALARRQGGRAWGRVGVLVNQMNELRSTLYTGECFDVNAAAVCPHDPANLLAVLAYCTSKEFLGEVRKIDQATKVTNATLGQVPFDLPHWQAIAAEKYPNGLPEPYSEDPTQWLFKGTVTPSDAPLQVAVARLLGYRWPDQPADRLDALADDDGIVCIPPVAGEVTAAERLRELLRTAYGSSWSSGREQTLLSDVGFANRSLDAWLRDGFFEQHCKLFHHRPFIWQVTDGHKEGFSALVNYHRLDHKALESLTFRYLGDWITRQRDADKRGEPGAGDRLRKAEELQRRLKLILDGEKPYDIFVRWKPPEQQPIGWNPDINDGVRLNIRPFMQDDVLRWKPNIKWGKDRGKNPPGAPYGEDRDNETHLTLADKAAARAAAPPPAIRK